LPKRIKHDDPSDTAVNIVRSATGNESYTVPLKPSKEAISAVMAALGRGGDPKDSAARAKSLSAAWRKGIAKKAVCGAVV
jgi:hypothetical protein